MKQMKSLLENPHGFSVSLVFDGLLVGIFAGCISVIYRLLLNNAEKLLFTIIAFTKTRPFWIAVWFIVLIVMGLIVGWLMSWEGMASGSGIPQVQGELKGYLNQNWHRVLCSKIIGGTLCILGGLSLGREGPSVQLGAMVAKGIAKITKKSQTKERYMMTCGAGAGLAAAFNAPLAGVMFSLEELQKNFNSSMLVCIISGCVTSDFISKNVFGLSPVFDFHLKAALPLVHYWMLILLGILLGLCGAFYNFIMLKGQDLFGAMKKIPAKYRIVFPFVVSGIVCYTQAFNKVKKNLNAPGFRKGHMPRAVFNQKFGEEALYDDALNAILPAAYEAAIAELGLDVVAQPKIDVKSIEKGQDWTLTAEVVTKPEVKLGAYKDLEVSVEASKEVTDEEVDAKLENERKNLAELVVKEGAAENGDTVVIDFVGSVDGVEFDGGKGENHSLELGSGQFIPGFEDQLVGAKAGDEVEVKVTFPEDYQAADLAGKAAVFVTKVNEVKAKEVPALDDELAKDLDDEVETLDELKAKYRKELEAAKEIAFDDAVEGAALDLAVENAEIVELPAEMVEDEVHRAMNEFMGNMQRQGISPEMYFQITGTTQEDLHKQYEADADKRVKTNLVIEAVAAAEGFDATEEEIQKEINDLAAEYNMEVSQVSALLSPEMLKHDITMKKAVEVITSTAKVK